LTKELADLTAQRDAHQQPSISNPKLSHYQIPAIYAPIKDSTVVVQANNYIVFDIIEPAEDTIQGNNLEDTG